MALGMRVSEAEDFTLSSSWKELGFVLDYRMSQHIWLLMRGGLKAFGFSAKNYEKILLPYVISFVMIIVTSEALIFLVF